ncbi:uncharacterized protein EI90DRAFT_1330827 [Cantharellus anzutake]|uniref:uncharacterized protein n=1 Tax=Cantharellus anzutake TaxID=1750568 RepID=UPI0019057138|nr:uncharacterized protein EI90DRAFT_1330827 [Cantharellus anzutake]KAF8342326.1 hypothetical protein EI90DRAFT_1330827 [Cantharellus anzutake]
MATLDLATFLSWFEVRGGVLDGSAVGFRDDSSLQRSVYALRDIPQGHTLFKIPRDLLLSTRTSGLRKEIGEITWSKLGSGWASLILCMMWEESKGSQGKWNEYFQILPNTFSTPMFWGEEDLKELEGTSMFGKCWKSGDDNVNLPLADKIGKEEAEAEYHSRIVPVLESRKDLFSLPLKAAFFTLENFHRLGSSILSRSFHVEEWSGQDKDPSDNDELHKGHALPDDQSGSSKTNEAEDTAMEVDDPPSSLCPPEETEQGTDALEAEDSDSDDEGEDTADISMVPMADMLNARYGCDNARLFYEPTFVAMITTKQISAGEEIWNTYGDPPNSDLLRRYGHVDVVPIPTSTNSQQYHEARPPWSLITKGNPADIMEIKANIAVNAFLELIDGKVKPKVDESVKERIDWWLESGNDDVFILESSPDEPHIILPEGLISIVRLLLLTDAEWTKLLEKSKPPKPKIESVEVAKLIVRVLQLRLSEYATSLEYDLSLLPPSLLTDSAFSIPTSPGPALSLNNTNAIIIRIGEKRLLHAALAHTQERLIELESECSRSLNRQDRDSNRGNRKRKGWKCEDDKMDTPGRKKAKR